MGMDESRAMTLSGSLSRGYRRFEGIYYVSSHG